MTARLGTRQVAVLRLLDEHGPWPRPGWRLPYDRAECHRILETLETRGLVERQAPAGHPTNQPVSSCAAIWHVTTDGHLEATNAAGYHR